MTTIDTQLTPVIDLQPSTSAVEISSDIFDLERNYTPDSKSVFLLNKPGLLDSINRPHPELFRLYKFLMPMEWDENEFQLMRCQNEFLSLPKNLTRPMIDTLAWQWEGDSTAAHSLVPVVAPFVSDDDLWLAYSRIGENEGLHALAYSEIVKYGLAGDPGVRMREVLANIDSLKRLKTVANALAKVDKIGTKVKDGVISRDSDEAIDAALLFTITVLGLERIQFMQSFAVTFALGELGAFMPIVETVQKIAMDEFTVHVPVGKYVIQNERSVPRSIKSLQRIRPVAEEILADILKSEVVWNATMFADDDSGIAGTTPGMFEDWIHFGMTDIYNTLGWTNPHRTVTKNPLPYMDDWLNINKNQGSPQEKRGGNYLLGGFTKSAEDVKFDVSDL